MTRSILLTALLCSLASAGEFEQRIAIALELAKEQPQETTVVVEKPEPIPAPEQEQPRYELRAVTKYRSETRTQCTYDRFGRKTCRRITVQVPYTAQERVLVEPQPSQEPAEAYATPLDAATRILTHIRPSSPKTLLDIGSGDGRMVVEWARWTGYPAIGIEQDPERVRQSRNFARLKGVSHLAKFLQGDYTKMDLPAADIVYVYQFPEDLAVLRDDLAQYPQVISYAHEVPGLAMTPHNGGEFYSWRKPVVYSQPVASSQPVGVWYSGKFYTRDNVPHNGRCNCPMCRWIKSELKKLGQY